MKGRIGLTVLFALALVAQGVFAANYDVVVVRGDYPVDLILGQTYARQAAIPLVSVSRFGITQEVEYELYGYRAQGYKNAVIIGGEDSVPPGVEQDLNRLNFTVTRLWDWNRYGTAARVAISLWEKADTVVVTVGDQPGTLLTAGRTAFDFKSPILLVETEKVPQETKQAIQESGASRIILIGNVSEEVKAELSELGGLQPTQQTQITIAKKAGNSKGLFLIGIIVGGLVIFLVSSLFSVGIFGQRREVPSDIFSADERKVLKEIENKKNLMQEDLPRFTGFSRVKVARITSELEERDIIEKKRVGKTHVLILKRPLK
ncbi:TPA: hypothetical protein H1012_00125 [archaeon]|nr:hypothetical protein [Candidatus Naiadarchaeales archaeon SRR2090159.bin1288]